MAKTHTDVKPHYAAVSTGLSLVEPAQTAVDAMCCGGGGARDWMEDEGEVGGRGNRPRLAQLQASGADQVAVACPFCMIMLEDARGALGAENLVIRDVAVIVADGLAAA